MKNIFKIMEEFGLELPEDKKKDFEKAVNENYKTVADYDKQKEKLTAAEDTIKANDTALEDLKKQLEGFKDVDVSALNNRISELEKERDTLKEDYQTKIADRDFQDILKESIIAAKGKDTEKIMRLLDTETLKASKNQKEDISAAIKAMTEDDVTKGMFGETEPEVTQTGNIIGTVTGGGVDAQEARMRAVMGLPPVPNTEQK